MEQTLAKTLNLGRATVRVSSVPVLSTRNQPRSCISFQVGKSVIHNLCIDGTPEEALETATAWVDTWDKFEDFLSNTLSGLVHEENSLKLRQHFVAKQISVLESVLKVG